MNQHVDCSLIVPAPIPSLRALQASPEVLTPVRHGFLWKRSRIFRAWISRWFQLDESGFSYAVSPKSIKREGQLVLRRPVREVLPLPPQRYRNGATMYGCRVVCMGGAWKDIYTDDRAALDAWVLDLMRSSPAAREAAHIKAVNAQAAAVAAAGGGAAPSLPPRLVPATGPLRLSDTCEVDWSQMLGSGLFACVLRGRMHGTGEAVAVKIIKADAWRQYSDIVQREAAVWAAVGAHPQIAQLRQTLRSNDRMYFIAELCDGGGLIERLATSATYCEREVAWLMRQLLSAILHLHDNAIVHMDIKPENLVFANRREDSPIKLIDFSLASFFYSPTDPGGTPDFVAPELLNQPDHYMKSGCGPEVDMWAVGVILFFLLSGQTPFQAPSLEQVLLRVKSGEWAFHGRRWALVSEGARDLVSSLLRVDPAQRLSAEEALHHPWLRHPDSLSQALLQDAVAAFRSAAAAAQQQLRTSWIKQASGDLMTTTGTNFSPHTSLSRFAMGAPGALAATAAGSPRTGNTSLTGIIPAGTPGDVITAGGGTSGMVMTSSSYLQTAHGGNFGRRSGTLPQSITAAGATGLLLGGGASSYTSSPSGASGNMGPPHHSSFTGPGPGIGARYAAAVAMAPHYSGPGNSPPRGPAATVRISPHSSQRLSPHVSLHSNHSPGGAPQCSPRSPLGMRTRRASDTMAYTLAITEREESLSQMQAQGIPVPTNAGMPWPALAAKARRASALAGYTSCNSPSDSQAEFAGSPPGTGATPALLELGNHSALGSRGGSYLPHHHPAQGYGNGGYVNSNPQLLRGASGLSVMTSARDEGRHTGGRSNPELCTLRHQLSSNGCPSGSASPADTSVYSTSRDGGGGGSGGGGCGSWNNQQPATSPTSQQQAPPQQSSQPTPQGASQTSACAGVGGATLSGTLPAADQALLTYAMLKSLRPGKSQSYNVMPSTWLDSQGRPLVRPCGSGPTTQGTATAGGNGSASAGGGGSAAAAGALQRRTSMSFTLGAAVPGVALMPHGPSPLSNASGGRVLTPGVLAAVTSAGVTAAIGGSLTVGGLPSGTSAFVGRRISRGGGSGGGGGGGGHPASRSGGSTPSHLSPANSMSNVQQPVYGSSSGVISGPGGNGSSLGAHASAGGGCGGGGSGFPSASSMYAAVLRANLSGQSLNVGAGSGDHMTATPEGGLRTSRSAGPSAPGSATHPHVTHTTAAAATSSGAAVMSGPAFVVPAGTVNRALSGSGDVPTASGEATRVAAAALRCIPHDQLPLLVQARSTSEALRPLSSSSNAILGAWDRGMSHGSFMEVMIGPSMSAAAFNSNTSLGSGGLRPLPTSGHFQGFETGPGGIAPCRGGDNEAASGRGTGPGSETVDSWQHARQHRSGSNSLACTALDISAGVEEPQLAGTSSGAQATTSIGPRSNSGGSPGGSPSIHDLLRSAGLMHRANSRLALETIPSEDPDSLSGLLRLVREDRHGGSTTHLGGGGGSTDVSNTPSNNTTLPQVPEQEPVTDSPLVIVPLRRQRSGYMSAALTPQGSNSLSGEMLAVEGRLGGSSSANGGLEQRSPVGGTPASGGSNGSRVLSHNGRRIRHAATVNNLRLHAAQAAAAQAAAAAAAAAAQAAAREDDHMASEPDPFAGWDWPPPPPPPPSTQSGHSRQQASSAVGLSGASLMALLEQAAPLAQQAQAFAAVQIAHSQSSSAGSSFGSQHLAWASRGPGGGGGDPGGMEGSEPPPSPFRVRRSLTSANLAFASPHAQLARLGSGSSAGAGGMDVAVAASVGGVGGGSGSGAGSSSTGGGSGPVGMNGSGSCNKQLAALLAQAMPLAQAAQANAASLSVSRAASYTSAGTVRNLPFTASLTTGYNYGRPAASSNVVSPQGRSRANSSATMYGTLTAPIGYEPAAAAAAAATSGASISGGWARRANTANDLRERSSVLQLSGASMMHRLASQQGPGGSGGVVSHNSLAGANPASPPREPGSPANSLSSRGSVFPAVPSRLSNSGNTMTSLRVGVGGSPALSPQSSQTAALATRASTGQGAAGAVASPASALSTQYSQQLQQLQQLQLLHQQQQQMLRQQNSASGMISLGRVSRNDATGAGVDEGGRRVES